VGQHVVADEEVGPPASGGEPAREGGAEEFDERFDALADCLVGRALGRLDAEARDAGLLEVLEQVAMGRGDFDDEGAGAQAQPLRHLLHIAAAVFEPVFRDGGEIDVLLAEDVFDLLILVHLHEAALAAHEDLQWIDRLGFVKLLLEDEGVGDGRVAQVHKEVELVAGAESAVHDVPPCLSDRKN